MPNRITKRRRKGQKSVSGSSSQTVTPSASTLASAEQLDATIETIDLALQISNVIKDVSEGSPLLAPLKASCLLVIRGLEVLRNAKRDPSEWNALVQSLETQKDEMETFATKLELNDRKCNAAIQSTFQSYLESLREVVVEASKPEEPLKRFRIERFTFMRHVHPVAQEQDAILPLKHRLDAAYQEFVCAAIREISAEVEERDTLAVQIYEDLQRVEEVKKQASTDDEIPYDYDSPSQLLYGLSVQCCEPGTRVALLEDIRRWSEDPSAKEQIYWLKDAAGTGKTTVAATMARDWQVDNLLSGRFFFTPNAEISSGIDQFCTAVAKDMAALVPSLKAVITTRLGDTSALHEGFHRQFQRLLLEPLQTLNPASPLILVIDALDNCDPIGRQVLLKYMIDGLSSVRHVKVLLTSRPSPDIIDVLSASSLVRGREVQLLDINDTIFMDVRIYVQSNLSKLTTDEREQLVGYSGGLFIVAATACRMLRRDRHPAKLLSKLLTAKSKDHLDELYLEILQQAMSDPSAHETMMKVLQIIIVAFQPISINTITAFLPEEVAVGKFVDDLGAVLKDGHPDRPIKVLHPTFREFLAEVDRANGFLVNNLPSHTLTAIGCLSVLDRSLDYDILGLRNSDHLLPRNVDIQDLDKIIMVKTNAAIRYASSYWSYHVAASLETGDLWLSVLRFLSTRLLNWLEFMSLRGDLRDCVQGLSQLRLKVLQAIREQGSSFFDTSSVSLLSQAYRFLLQHQPVIQESALQTYSSALSFTPEGSPLLDAYRTQHESRMPKVTTPIPSLWSAQDVMSGHSCPVRQVVISADSSRLATRDRDGSVILWDINSGAIVGYPFKGSTPYFGSVAFSPDGERLVFGGASRLHLWNATNGNPQYTIDTGHGDIVQVAFSPVHQQVISASKEPGDGRPGVGNKIKFWSALNGQKVGQTLSLDGNVRCFALSPDGSRLVSISREWQFSYSVILWSLESFIELSEYRITIAHGDLYVRYSPRGNRFVTWDKDGTLYLRDGLTGDSISTMKREEKSLRSVCFSPSGHIMASYYGWETPVILLWDPETGLQTFTLSGHTSTISEISFSQDGLCLASISTDQTVRVWDTATGDSLDTFFKGYTGHTSHPTLSPDWTKFVTVSITHQISLYDIKAGTMQGMDVYEDVHLDLSPPYVGFSPNKDVVACGYLDLNNRSTLGVWNLESCARVGAPMVGHDGGISSVCFSPDALKIISISEDGTARIWDATNGAPIGGPIPLPDGYFARFSPDNKLVVCASHSIVEIWDINTTNSLWRMETSSWGVATFSPDSSQIIFGLKDQMCIWDIAAGSNAPPVAASEHGHQADGIAFSPTDDSLMASASGKSIKLWRVANGVQLLSELAIEVATSLQLGISSDGKFLAYGPFIWDISLLPDPPISLNTLEKYPKPSDWNLFPHSLLTYKDGWIYSGSPPCPLVAVPRDLWFQFRRWDSCGTKVVTWTQKRLPFVVDVAPLLS